MNYALNAAILQKMRERGIKDVRANHKSGVITFTLPYEGEKYQVLIRKEPKDKWFNLAKDVVKWDILKRKVEGVL